MKNASQPITATDKQQEPDTAPQWSEIDEEILHAYVDNRLDATVRQQVEELMQRDPQTAQRVEIYLRQLRTLNAAFGAEPDTAFRSLMDTTHTIDRQTDSSDDGSPDPSES